MQRYIRAHKEHCARAALGNFKPLALAKFLDIAIAIELEDMK